MKNKKLFIIAVIILSGVVIYSGVRFFLEWREYDVGNKIYNNAASTFVTLPTDKDYTDPYIPDTAADDTADGADDANETSQTAEQFPDLRVNFEELRKINPDIMGWIWIPDTGISFPLLLGSDNYHYLYYAYNNERSKFGSIFLDYRNSPDFSDENSIIYGHNMRNEAMFGTLSAYEDLEFAQSHQTLYIFTEETTYRFTVFSAYTANVEGFPYVLTFDDPEIHGQFLRYITDKSVSIKPEVPLELEDRVLTLSTCLDYSTDEYRFVIHARLDATHEN